MGAQPPALRISCEDFSPRDANKSHKGEETEIWMDPVVACEFKTHFQGIFLSLRGGFFPFFFVLEVSRIIPETWSQGCLWHWAGGNSMKALNTKINACHCCWHLELPGLCMSLHEAMCWKVPLMNRYRQADCQRSILHPISGMVAVSACPRHWPISPVLRPRGSSASGVVSPMQM